MNRYYYPQHPAPRAHDPMSAPSRLGARRYTSGRLSSHCRSVGGGPVWAGKNSLATLLASTSDMDSRIHPRQCPRLLIGALNYVFARSMPSVIGTWTATTEKRRITITTAGK